MSEFPTYWDYLHLDGLLSLQSGLEDDESKISSDELHFIVVHQVYELWFKLMLRELREARDELAAPRVAEETVPQVVHHLRRVTRILELMVQQWSVVETLTPQDFLAFRDKLIPASGFQSFQMREVELLLGLQDSERLRYGGVDPVSHIQERAGESPTGARVMDHLETAHGEQSLRDALHDWLYRTPVQGSSPGDSQDSQVVDQFLESYLVAYSQAQQRQMQRLVEGSVVSSAMIEEKCAAAVGQARGFLLATDAAEDEQTHTRRVRAGLVFIESYRELPLLAWPRTLVDAVVEVEEQFVLWRNRHARMVERTIGRRIGTGGSSGVDYLDEAAKGRVFPELWAVRTLLLAKGDLPPLQHPEFYGFAL